MHAPEMEQIADWIARVLVERIDPAVIAREVVAFRERFQTLYYTFEEGAPPYEVI
jgi:glycine hydroxymethyltransferase